MHVTAPHSPAGLALSFPPGQGRTVASGPLLEEALALGTRGAGVTCRSCRGSPSAAGRAEPGSPWSIPDTWGRPHVPPPALFFTEGRFWRKSRGRGETVKTLHSGLARRLCEVKVPFRGHLHVPHQTDGQTDRPTLGGSDGGDDWVQRLRLSLSPTPALHRDPPPPPDCLSEALGALAPTLQTGGSWRVYGLGPLACPPRSEEAAPASPRVTRAASPPRTPTPATAARRHRCSALRKRLVTGPVTPAPGTRALVWPLPLGSA